MGRAGVTLNSEKCSFSQPKVKFLGHIVDKQGISADLEKTAAVREMRAPTNISELRQFLGMANQLGEFSRNLAELSQPLRDLLNKKRSWLWGADQNLAFRRVKEELTKPLEASSIQGNSSTQQMLSQELLPLQLRVTKPLHRKLSWG